MVISIGKFLKTGEEEVVEGAQIRSVGAGHAHGMEKRLIKVVSESKFRGHQKSSGKKVEPDLTR